MNPPADVNHTFPDAELEELIAFGTVESHRGGELGLARPVFERRLVALHARAAPAGEHQSVERWLRRGVHVDLPRAGFARRGRSKSRLPPRLRSRRTGPISMSCESALHMS